MTSGPNRQSSTQKVSVDFSLEDVQVKMILIHRMLHEVSLKVTRHYFAGAAVIQNSKIKIIQISISRSARNQTLCAFWAEKCVFCY